MDGIEGRGLRREALAGGERARAAFARLWGAYYRLLLVFASAYRGLPPSEREDEVAESLIAAFGALAGYDPERPLGPWLYRIAANRFADAARRASRLSGLELGGRAPGALDPPSAEDREAEAAGRDLADRCQAAIAALPDRERRVAILRFYEGMDSRRIGRVLGMPAGTVRWRLRAIRERIAREAGEGR